MGRSAEREEGKREGPARSPGTGGMKGSSPARSRSWHGRRRALVRLCLPAGVEDKDALVGWASCAGPGGYARWATGKHFSISHLILFFYLFFSVLILLSQFSSVLLLHFSF